MAYERVTLYGVPLVADRLVAVRPDRPRAEPRALHPARPRLRRVVDADTASSRRTSGCSRRPRSSSTAPAGATSSSTSTRCSTSTTRGSGPRSSAAPTSTSGGSRSGVPRPDLLTFDPAMLTHDTAERGAGRRLPRGLAAGEGLTFPISYHFEPGAADDGLTIDVPVATLNRVGRRRLLLERPGRAARAGHQPDPQPAEEPPGQLRAGAGQGPRVPGRRPARRRAAARRARALGALDDRRGRPARRLGLVEGAGPPAADLPRRRRRPATSRPAARTSRRSRRRCAAEFDAGARGGRRRQRAGRHRPDRLDLRRAARGDPADPGRARGARPIPRSSTRARPSGSGCSASRDEAESRHRLGVRRLAAARARPPATRPPASTPPRTARPGRLAVPHRRRAARRPAAPRSSADVVDGARRPSARPRSTPRWWRPARDALAERTEPRASPRCCGSSSDWRDTDRMLSGRAELATLPALQDMREQLARLVGRGFLGEAGADRLRRFPTYLLAIRRRRERLGGRRRSATAS